MRTLEVDALTGSVGSEQYLHFGVVQETLLRLAPLLTADAIDVHLDYESVAEAGSLLGTGAVMVLDETDCVVEAAERMVQFYAHESCGKCTPCREGSWWATRVLGRLEDGYGREEDLPLMHDMGTNILFRAFCALADGTASVINSSLKHFEHEYLEHVRLGRCPLRAPSPFEEVAS